MVKKSSEEKHNVTIEQFDSFVKDLIEQLNESFKYTYSRFDSIDTRLTTLEIKIKDLEQTMTNVQSKVSSVKQDTTLLPPIFGLLEQDGRDIAKLKLKVSKLDG